MTNAPNKIYNAIDEILWFEWDPKGVNNVAPRNEYENYTLMVYGLKISGANQHIIARKLYEIETDTMDLVGNLERCQEIAKKIYELLE